MKRHLWIAVVVIAAAAACGESFPEPYDELGLPTDGLFSSFPQGDGKVGVVGLYRKGTDTQAVIAGWDAALRKKGYKPFCERKHGDGSINRGYENTGESRRYLFTAGGLGEQTEASLLEVPAKIPSAEVCPAPEP